MRKHIEKRCLTQFKTTEQISELFDKKKRGPIGALYPAQFPDNSPEKFSAMMITEDYQVLMGFPFEEDNKVVVIPELDPILVYFDTAYSSFKVIKERRKNMLGHFKGEEMEEHYINALYSYYGCVNTFVMMLFTAVEAFINYNIPENYVHRKILTNKVKSSDKDRIMRYFSFDQKMEIINDVFKKDFKLTHSIEFDLIIKLKEFRDSLIHLKPEKGNNVPYSYIYKHGLNFPFEETMDAVMDFMNFYKADSVRYCGCSKDF